MRRRPIGQILLDKQAITEEHLAAALAEQERTGKRLGEILIESGQISWLAFARALAEQVLDLEGPSAEPEQQVEREPERPDPVELLRAMAEKVANLPPVPDPVPPPQWQAQPAVTPPLAAQTPLHDSEQELARAVAEQIASLDTPAPPRQQTHLLRLTPAPPPIPAPDSKLHNVEAMLRERQRAFIELVTTAETLRAKIAWLEDQLEERTRELARLRARVA
jgi:hypothetical protein